MGTSLTDIFKNGLQLFKSHSPEIMTAVGVVGVATTAYLASKATVEAVDIIRQDEAYGGTLDDPKERLKERVKHTWRLYIPTAVSGTVSVACIIGASKASSSRTAAAVTAYSLTERAFKEYREKVVEEVGKNKEQKIRDAVAQDHISRTSGSNEVIVFGPGQVLCCELYTKRYFKSDMESLLKARNEVNHLVNHRFYVPLDEFYDLIGLPHTDVSDKLGWNSNKQMALDFTSTISESGEPCLAFRYNYVDPL